MTDAERIAAIVADHWPTESNRVAEWHPDDQVLYRDYTRWGSFEERHDLIVAQRQRRMVDALTKALQANRVDQALVQIRDLLAAYGDDADAYRATTISDLESAAAYHRGRLAGLEFAARMLEAS